VIAVAASIAVGVIVHLFLEMPILNVLRGLPKRLQHRKQNDA
jgi:energy-converting hydrogenase Eha subunit A